jgi:hypothetical protein
MLNFFQEGKTDITPFIGTTSTDISDLGGWSTAPGTGEFSIPEAGSLFPLRGGINIASSISTGWSDTFIDLKRHVILMFV